MFADPIADEVVANRDLKPVVTQVKLGRFGIKPDVETQLSHFLRNGISEFDELRIIRCADDAHGLVSFHPDCRSGVSCCRVQPAPARRMLSERCPHSLSL